MAGSLEGFLSEWTGETELSFRSGWGMLMKYNKWFIFFLLTCVQIRFAGSPSGLISSEAAFVIKLCGKVVSLHSPAKCLQHLFGIGASSHQLIHINQSKGAASPSGWRVDFSYNTSGGWGELLPTGDRGSPLPIYQKLLSHPPGMPRFFLGQGFWNFINLDGAHSVIPLASCI